MRDEATVDGGLPPVVVHTWMWVLCAVVETSRPVVGREQLLYLQLFLILFCVFFVEFGRGGVLDWERMRLLVVRSCLRLGLAFASCT